VLEAYAVFLGIASNGDYQENNKPAGPGQTHKLAFERKSDFWLK